MEEIEIFEDEYDAKAEELMTQYNRVIWLGVSENQTTIISYNDMSWVKRKLISWILGIVWGQPNV